MRASRSKEKGAVSLFIVIFVALLITTITVAFVRLMLQSQEQATMNDLSKSALDSAYAGVEDAKRAIVTYREHCGPGGDGTSSAECVKLTNALNSNSCQTLQDADISGSPGDKEVLVKQTEGNTGGDAELQQAYTCVKVQMDTPDFLGTLSQNAPKLIPLKSQKGFNRVNIEWYSQDDLQAASGSGSSGTSIDLGQNDPIEQQKPGILPKLADWPNNRPALLRVQLIQFGDTFNLSDFDKDENGQTDNATLFLKPSTIDSTGTGQNIIDFGSNVRQSQVQVPDQPVLISCNKNFAFNSTDGQFACKATLQLPDPIGGNADNRRAYLRVDEIYNPSTTFSVSLQDQASNPVKFSAVQPMIDSTGRANDLFRRVRARVELESSSIPAVQATVDLTGSLCKSFLITDNPNDYKKLGNCNNGATP